MKLKALNKKYQIALLVIAIMLIISGVSYAYFAVTATGTSNNNIVTSGTMKINFNDGPEVSLENAIPGDTLSKTFSVTNTGNVTSNYNIDLSDVSNTFANQSDLVYTLTSDSGVNITSDTQLPGEDDSLSTNIAIGVGETHNYTLTIKFLNKNQAQDTNQGKQYSAKVNIIEYDIAQENALKVLNVNYNYNYKTIAMVDGEVVSTIPDNNGTVAALSVNCDNGVTGKWDSNIWGLTLTNLSNNSTTCTINFGTVLKYDYTGAEQTFTVPKTAYYKIETWGAQGGNAAKSAYSCTGGYGGYSEGIALLNKSEVINIVVGGQGQSVDSNGNPSNTYGYNGGGYAGYSPTNSSHSGGGGATHIATTTGLLSTLSNHTDSILIVSGGGSGCGAHVSFSQGNGSSGGGYVGGQANSCGSAWYTYGTGGTQTAIGKFNVCSQDHYTYINNPGNAAAFGLGSNYSSFSSSSSLYYVYSGGGGGYYGGGEGHHGPGGGGSGYIANSLLLSSSSNSKHMTCYNCSTSSESITKTITTVNFASDSTSDYAKEGNGYAKITYIGTSID